MRNFFKALFFGLESDSGDFMLRWKTLNSSAGNEGGRRLAFTPVIRPEREKHNSPNVYLPLTTSHTNWCVAPPQALHTFARRRDDAPRGESLDSTPARAEFHEFSLICGGSFASLSLFI